MASPIGIAAASAATLANNKSPPTYSYSRPFSYTFFDTLDDWREKRRRKREKRKKRREQRQRSNDESCCGCFK